MGNEMALPRLPKGTNERNEKPSGNGDTRRDASKDSDAMQVDKTGDGTATKPTRRKVVMMEESAHSFGRDKDTSVSPQRNTLLHQEPKVIGDSLQDVRAKYHINSREIGHGHYSVVRKCMHRETGVWYAVKSILKSKVKKVEVLKREIAILQEVNHPHIIRLYEVYEDANYLHLVTELCTGGELFDRIIAKTKSNEGCFSEHDAAELILCILDAIAYCHDVKQIVHRDLKPENFLYLTKAEDSPIKIIDFGLSRHDTQNFGVMKTRVGTPYYVAPEVLKREYTKSCDIWSIGVITYILLCGYPPFYGDSDNQIFDSIRSGEFDFPSPEWDNISTDAKDFICLLLRKNPSERLTAAEAMEHKWIKDQLADETMQRKLASIRHTSHRSVTFKKYMGMKKLKKAALTEIANDLTQAEIGSLGDIFHSIDVDGDGIMSLSDLDNALKNGNFSAELQDKLKELREDLCLSGEDTLNYKEFLAATMEKNLAVREDKVRLAFDHFRHSDKNCLLFSDLVEIFGGEEQAREIMGLVDTDGDGRISFDEFQKAIMDSMEDDL